MSSLQKRVTLGWVVSLFLIAAGVAIFFWAGSWLDLSHRVNTPGQFNDDLADAVGYRFMIGGLLTAVGASFAGGGFCSAILTLVIWIRKVPAGSRLTLRGWQPPGEISQEEVSTDKAWLAAGLGLFGSVPWIMILCGNSVRGLLMTSHITPYLIAILIVECSLFYGFGIRLCRRRDRSNAQAAKGPWAAALALNYGGLLAFLCFLGTVFLLRARG